MPYDVGTARGVIEFDYDGKGVDQAVRDQGRLEKGGKTSGASMDQAGRSAGRAGLVIAGGLALGINAAANFEQRLSAIQAVSGASEKQMGKLSDKALQLGKDTSFSAGESASAMEELIKAGLSVGEVLGGAADATVALAAAGEIDLTQAATIASNSMNQFNLKAKDMTGVVDTIAGAANSSAIDVGDFGQSLQQVGAVANLAGVDFDDTATAIALMGNAGIKGSDAGTSLKSMFMRLQPTTKKQTNLFKDLGIITKEAGNRFYDQEGNLKSLDKVSGILQGSLKGMTKEQKQAALQTLFGSDAIRAAAILTKEGAKGFDKMSESIGKTSAADVAKTRLDNFKGSVEQLMGSLETLGITMGTLLLPILRRIVDALTGLVNWFTNLSSGQQKVIVSILAGVAAFLLLFAAAVKIARAITIINGALTIIRGSFIATWLAAIGPIAILIAALAGIVIIFILLWKKSEAFRNFWIGLWDIIKGAAQAVANWFTGTIVPSFGTAWGQLKTGLRAVGNFFVAVWDKIKSATSSAWNAIKSAVSAAIRFLVNIFLNFTGPGLIIKHWDTIKRVTSDAWNKIKETVSDAIQNIIKFHTEMPDKILKALGSLRDLLVNAGEDLIRGLIDGIGNMADAAADAAEDVARAAVHKVASALGLGSPSKVFYQIGEWVGEGFANGINSMAGLVAKESGDLTDAMIRAIGSPEIQATIAAAQSPMAASLSPAFAGVPGGLGATFNPVIPPNPQSLVDVRVYIGDKELTDQVRIVVGETLAPLTTYARQGASA